MIDKNKNKHILSFYNFLVEVSFSNGYSHFEQAEWSLKVSLNISLLVILAATVELSFYGKIEIALGLYLTLII